MGPSLRATEATASRPLQRRRDTYGNRFAS